MDDITPLIAPKEIDLNDQYLGQWKGKKLDRNKIIIDLREAQVMNHHHWHPHVEINIPLDGSIQYLVNGKKEQVVKGEIAMFLALIPHRVIDVNQCSKLAIIYLSLDEFLMTGDQSMIERVLAGEFVLMNQSGVLPESKIAEWQSEINGHCIEFYEIAYRELQMFLKRVFIKESQSSKHNGKLASSKVKNVIRILEIVNEKYTEPVTNIDIAKCINMNPNYVAMLFSKTIGLPLKQYILLLRIAYAQLLLAETPLSIADIIYKVGFTSKNSFYLAFNKKVGMSPKEYRAICFNHVDTR